MTEIYQIINEQFEKNFFYDSGSAVTNDNLKLRIKEFEEQHPDALIRFLKELKDNFPEAKIENWTQFFNLDRCIRFLVETNKENKFICQLSIFGYFCVYKHTAHIIEGQYDYDKIHFYNPNESEVCDKIYNCSLKTSVNPIWLKREVLEEIVQNFSLIDSDPLFRHEISVADILFTSHYL